MFDAVLQSLGFQELSPFCQVLAAIVAAVIALTGGWGAGKSIVRASVATVRTGLRAGRLVAQMVGRLRRSPVPAGPPSELFDALDELLNDTSLWEIDNSQQLDACDTHLVHLGGNVRIGFADGDALAYHCGAAGTNAVLTLCDKERANLDQRAEDCLDAVAARGIRFKEQTASSAPPAPKGTTVWP